MERKSRGQHIRSKDFEGTHDPTENQIFFKVTHLGMMIAKHRVNGKNAVSMDQTEHLTKSLERLGIDVGHESAKPVKTPFPSGCQNVAHLDSLDLKEDEKTWFRSATAALNYAAVQTRPDLKLPVSMMAKHFNDPKAEHVHALKCSFTTTRSPHDRMAN
jgi:hypothetical protein